MASSLPATPAAAPSTGIRLAELLAALSLAMDLGLGQPLEHVLRTCLIAMRLARAAGASPAELRTTYYGALLRFVGCSADAHDTAPYTGGDDIALGQAVAPMAMAEGDELAAHLMKFGEARPHGAIGFPTPQAVFDLAGAVLRTHCEVAAMCVRRLGLGEPVAQAVRHGFARWDGGGFPAGVARDALPLASRVVVLARDVEVLTRTLGVEAALDVIRRRRGRAYDPQLVDFVASAQAWCGARPDASAWEEFLDAEPEPPLVVEGAGDAVDRVLELFADVADSKVPALLGHSRAVAGLAERAARDAGRSAEEIARLRRAALVHDLGRVGVPNKIWERPGPLAPWERERMQLHPYLSERMLARCGPLSALAPLAGAHHERLDGSGYHRGSVAAALPRAARLLAAADVLEALTQPRPHRAAHAPAAAASVIREEVRAGRLDRDAVDAVLAAAGVSRRARRAPASTALSDRELEVLRLVCRGHSNRQTAARLGISAKTVDHHVQHIYAKTGVSTRAALALLALEQGLLQG